MEVEVRVDAAIKLVEEARGVPLSASCVIHRTDLLELLDGVRVSLPAEFAQANEIIRNERDILENARLTADQMIENARDQVAQMVAETEIVAAAKREAQRIMDDVHEQARIQQGEIDHYIDSRLATLEVILNKTLDVVARGRDRLSGVDAKSALKELDNEK
jgi:polyhydroxyalkanoate synthesis regulator phasin